MRILWCNWGFIMKNIFLNDYIKNSEIKRYDWKDRSIISLIEKEKLNDEFKWISYDIFKYYLKLIQKLI